MLRDGGIQCTKTSLYCYFFYFSYKKGLANLAETSSSGRQLIHIYYDRLPEDQIIGGRENATLTYIMSVARTQDRANREFQQGN